MTLDATERRHVRLSLAVCAGDWEALRAVRAELAPDGLDRALREALLQTHLFAGFPRLVEAWEVLAEAGGVGAPTDDEGAPEPPEAERQRAGAALFETIYGDNAKPVSARLEGFHPHLAAWIESHAYGRVLTRPGLEPRRRELYACACLAAAGQDRQLASHVRGALRVGAARDELAEVFELVRACGGSDECLRRATAVLARFAG